MDRETALKAYSLMVTSRAIDDRCKQLLADRQAVPNYHSGTGQEAMSVGIGLAAQPNDYLLYTYRDFGMLLAKGLDLDALVGDLLLRTSGSTRGHGGIMHVVAPELGIVRRNGVFGSRFGIAIGLALAAVRQGQPRVVICPFGEAESGRGPLYEALNIACLSKLPVLFVAQNNGFSISARTESIYAPGDMSGFWRGAPLPVSKIDGNDMHAVHSAAAAAAEHCRAGLGPSFLECMTYRIDPHIPIDTEAYRGREEVDALASARPDRRLGCPRRRRGARNRGGAGEGTGRGERASWVHLRSSGGGTASGPRIDGGLRLLLEEHPSPDRRGESWLRSASERVCARS